jgi:outer membrane protein OmpA-like peptidoglycan-associated protein
VYFARGSAELTEYTRTTLEVEWARYLKAMPDWEVATVVGHADEEGSPEEMLELSRRRAQAVAHALVELGVPRETFGVTAYGDTKQGLEEPGEEWAPWNRRCDLALGPKSD